MKFLLCITARLNYPLQQNQYFLFCSDYNFVSKAEMQNLVK